MRYFIMNEGAQQGPYSIYDLKDLSLDANAFVREEGSNEWMRAKEVDELRRFLGFSGDEPLPPQVQSVEAVPVKVSKPKKSRTGCIVFLLLFIIITGAMVVTNPSKERHTEVISERMGDIIEATLQPTQQQPSANLGEALIRGGIDILKDIFGSKTTQDAIGTLLDYHNYFLFSTTSIQLMEKQQTLSIGAFGHIFTVNEDNIRRFSEKNTERREESSVSTEPRADIDDNVTPQEPVEESVQPNEGTKKNDIVNDIEQEIIRSIGNIAKRQVEQRTDSTTGSALGKVIDGVTDILKEHMK